MAEAKTPETVIAKIDRSAVGPSPDFRSYYANDTQVQVTKWDARMVFGVIVDVPNDNEKFGVQRVAEVRMSLQHAKRVAEVLSEQIRMYEQRVGPLLIPQD
jgi:hypothetical protein